MKYRAAGLYSAGQLQTASLLIENVWKVLPFTKIALEIPACFPLPLELYAHQTVAMFMISPRRQSENPPNAAFFDQCGARIEKTCSNCGEPNRHGAKCCSWRADGWHLLLASAEGNVYSEKKSPCFKRPVGGPWSAKPWRAQNKKRNYWLFENPMAFRRSL